MSMISKQIEDLESLKGRLERKDAMIVGNAIDTIQAQSAKLAANNFHGGWIPCCERLPEDEKEVLTCWEMHSLHTNTIYRYVSILYHLTGDGWYNEKGSPNGIVTHWMELPELPKLEDKQC